VAVLDMQLDQSDQYHSMEGMLKSLAIQSNRYLSTWLQWSLARPNSAFRDEMVMIDQVENEGKIVRKVPYLELPAAVSGKTWLPKESWLADFCRAEKGLGRKVLVYVRQTGTRDIQDRILQSLESAGLRATILSSSVNPRQREAWIEKRADSLDVLICNPKLVETGLDLVQFSSIVFAEIEYSLYTLWQALRRVWRLGQTKPVKAIFSVYNGSMEARALALMGAKMKASQLLYGDEVGGAIVPEDDGDFLTQLARDVLKGAKLDDLQSLFADESRVSHNPLGCPTMPSAPMPMMQLTLQTWNQWAEDHNYAKKPSKRNEKLVSSQNQTTLW
jgi:SNF2 family DNA or RNA helicase